MPVEFRPCQPQDVDDILPLMYSAGPEAFRHVFSIDTELQVLDFLRRAFIANSGEFGYKDHLVALEKGDIVALVGMRRAHDNLNYTLSIAKTIFGFYGLTKGLRVATRGLLFERIVSPPARGVLCLHNLGVREDRRGRGYGRAVIEHVVALARKMDVRAVGLDVAETNPRAKALYLGLGFTVVSTTPGGARSEFGRAVGHDYMEYVLEE